MVTHTRPPFFGAAGRGHGGNCLQTFGWIKRKKKESKKTIHQSENGHKIFPFPSKFIDLSPPAGIIKASIFACLKFFHSPTFNFFCPHPPNFPLTCHCDCRVSPSYTLEAAHCGICIHSTGIQCYCGQHHPNVSWRNMTGMPAP